MEIGEIENNKENYNHKKDPPLYPHCGENENFDEYSKRVYKWEREMKKYQQEHLDQKRFIVTSDDSENVKWTKFKKFDIIEI